MKVILPTIIACLILLTNCKQSTNNTAKVEKQNLPLCEIPFQFIKNKIHVDVKINVHGPFDFIFDTGAPFFFIDSAAAASLNMKKFNEISAAHTLGGVTINKLGSIKSSITLGKLDLKPEIINIINANNTISKYDGVIGSALFEDYVVKINFSTKKILLFNFNDFKPGREQAFNIGNDVFQLTVNAMATLKNGKKIKGRFLIDTGASNSCIFDTSTENCSTNVIDGNGIIIPANEDTLNSLEIETLVKKNLPILTIKTSGRDFIGNIGCDVLSDFDITINHKLKKIYYKPIVRNTNQAMVKN